MKTKLTLFLLLTTSLLFSQTKLDYKINQYYNGTSWVNSGKTEYQYNANNNAIVFTEYSWDNTNTWNKEYRVLYSYNNNGDIIEFLEQEWDNGANLWENSYKSVRTYNANNNPILFIDYEWNGSQWENSYKTEISYSGVLISQHIYYEWDGTQWLPDSKGTYIYNANNNIDTIIDEDWDGAQYNFSAKTVYIYDANNRIFEIIEQERNGGQWTNSYKTEFQIDANLNRVYEIEYDFASSWSFNSKTDYTYDTSKLLSDITNPFNDNLIYNLGFENNPFVNKILEETQSNYATGMWTPNNKTTYHYVNTTSINDVNTVAVSIYPNPATNFINIDSNNSFIVKKINIYDLLGRRIVQTSKKQINIEPLEKGVYTVEIIDKNNNYIIEKFIKK